MCFFFKDDNPLFSGHNLLKAALNLGLIQAWSPNSLVYYSFNGAAWFLSALIFCYFMSPAFMKLVKNVKKSTVTFLAIATVRIFIEYVRIHFPGEFWNVNVHVSPWIRSMEFLMGMLLVPIFFAIYNYMEEHKSKIYILTFTLIEVLAVMGYLYVAINKQNEWIRGYYVVIACVLMLIFAFDKGVISRIFAIKPLMWFSSIQFEFFIFHQTIIYIYNHYYREVFTSYYSAGVVLFIITIIIAVIYKLLLSKHLSKLLMFMVNQFKAIWRKI